MPQSAGKPKSGSIVPTLRVKAYPVVARAVEEGVLYGIHRLWKYYDGEEMPEAHMRERAEAVINAVMDELCEVIEFDLEPEP